jgi:sugar transferase (PEP-CTERM/EpsH1 system associated)
MKKHILLIAHRIPYPPDKGDKIRTYHMMRYLAERYQVTVVCMIDDPDDVKYIKPLRQMVYQVYYKVRTTRAMKARAVGSLLNGTPFTQHCFYSRPLQKIIDRYLDQYNAAAILSFCSSSAEYIFRSRHALEVLQKKVLLNDLIDVDSEKWRQYAEKHHGLKKWAFQREARLLQPGEARIIADFDRTFIVSEEEKNVLASFCSVEKVEALSNGVDLDYFSPERVPKTLRPTTGPKLLFSGAMNYWPNIEGAIWFAERVFPTVREMVPDAVFCIAGRNPANAILALKKKPGIEVSGTVPDMREYLSCATICVAPLLIARGIQNKVLEGMAMKKPVVATRGAATGLKSIDGEEIIITDDEKQMAKVIIKLLKDTDRCLTLGAKAREYVEREHSWESHLGRLVELIEGKEGSN